MVNNPHDKLFKKIFSQPEKAAELLRINLQPALLAHIDLRSLVPLHGSFVDDSLRERFTDLLFSAQIAEREGFVYLLLEHKSRSDGMTAFQLARYVMNILSDYLSKNSGMKVLPAVIPLVVHHGAGQWRAARRLVELYDLPDELRASVGEYLLDLGFVMDDISAESDEDLRSRAMAAQSRLALWLLKQQMRKGDLVTALPRAKKLFQEAVAEMERAESGLQMFVVLLQYITEVSDAPPDLMDAAFRELEPRTTEVYMSTAEKLREEGRREAMEGQRGLFLMLLEQRFGPLPDRVSQRVSQASASEINAWARAALTASSLDEIAGLNDEQS